MKKSALAVAIAVVGSFAVVGCGGSSSSSDQAQDNVIDTGNGNDNDNGGVEFDGQFIVDTGYVAGTSAYTGLTSVNGVVYASRIDATGDVDAVNGKDVYNSVILRAAEGADEFTVVQEIPGEKIGGLDAVMVNASEDDAGNVVQDGLVVACLSGHLATLGTPGVDQVYDDTKSEPVALRFYFDQTLADTAVIESEEKTEFEDLFNVSDNVGLNTCVDLAVASRGELAGTEDTEFTIAVVGVGYYRGTRLGEPLSLSMEAMYSTYFREADEVLVGPNEVEFQGPAYDPDRGPEGFVVNAVEVTADERAALGPLNVLQYFGSTFFEYGLTNVADSVGLLAAQDDNVFSGAQPQAMALSSLQQFPGSTRFYAVHEMSEQSLNGLAVIDTDGVVGVDGSYSAPTRFENVGQVGLFCRGELTFVGQQGLCLDGTNPGTFRFFEVPVDEVQ